MAGHRLEEWNFWIADVSAVACNVEQRRGITDQVNRQVGPWRRWKRFSGDEKASCVGRVKDVEMLL